MRLLKTVLLSTTLLMSAPFGAEHVPGETSNVNKAEAEVFTNGLRAIRNEQAAQLTFTVEMLKDLPVSEAEKKPDNVTNALLTISECIDALIRNQTTLETDLATATGKFEALKAEQTRALGALGAKAARENDDVDRFLADDEHAVPAQPAGGFVTLEEHKAVLKKLEEITAENERLKAAQPQSVDRTLFTDVQSDAAQNLAAIRSRRTTASGPQTQSEVSGRHSMGSGSTAQVIAVHNGRNVTDGDDLSPFKSSTEATPARPAHYIDGMLGSKSPVSRQTNKPGDNSSRPDSHTTTPNAKAAEGDDVATTPVVARPSAHPATPAAEAGPTTAGDAATPAAEARPAADETAVDPNAAERARLQREIADAEFEAEKDPFTGKGSQAKNRKHRETATAKVVTLKAELAALTNPTK